MKTLIILSFISTFFFPSTAQNTIEVEMYNFKNDKGKVKLGLYNSAEEFLENSFLKTEVKILNQEARAIFTNIPDGIYAIGLYHDEDGDGELDMFLGIPTENYGVSNNAKPTLSKPHWEDASFEVKDGETVIQEISL